MKPSLFRIVAAAALLLAAASGLSARRISDPVLRRILDSAARENRTMNHLDILCNRFGGRPLGSDAYTHAADWAVWQFRQWGLQAEKEWVCDLPVGFNRGPWSGRSVLGDEALHFATPSYTAGTKGLQRGHVVLEPRTRADLERMKKTLKGAWVLIGGTSRGWPVDWSENGDRRRAEIIARNDSIDRANAAIRRENRESGTDKPLIPRIEEPALFYREMVEAGIRTNTSSAAVTWTVLTPPPAA